MARPDERWDNSPLRTTHQMPGDVEALYRRLERRRDRRNNWLIGCATVFAFIALFYYALFY